jgi:hypothetical protein
MSGLYRNHTGELVLRGKLLRGAVWIEPSKGSRWCLRPTRYWLSPKFVDQLAAGVTGLVGEQRIGVTVDGCFEDYFVLRVSYRRTPLEVNVHGMDDGGKFASNSRFAEPMNVDMLGTLPGLLVFQKERVQEKNESSLRGSLQNQPVMGYAFSAHYTKRQKLYANGFWALQLALLPNSQPEASKRYDSANTLRPWNGQFAISC